ncbi:hypothetical protein J1N35_003821 [Gossypium stocksii]|uniref:Hcy-binding domain-containing protein n=1 Tax=Gossypium stocksii TaxID=47602 RepID=A0A9D3WB54_9ROSI|nr:hypothetical protein J1N35_003821 [Gossypium stocksii]
MCSSSGVFGGWSRYLGYIILPVEARDKFWDGVGCFPGNSYNRALVAALIGSYGAYLADGSEYSGCYGPGVNLDKLKDFYPRRLQVIVEAGPDLLAFETIPNKLEAQLTTKAIVVYPNSGAIWDGRAKKWLMQKASLSFFLANIF